MKSIQNNLQNNNSNIFIIGFMGCGKSYWGKIWAAYTQKQFIDLDELIEETENKTISTIFEQQGETAFRAIETSTLKILSNKSNCIISCGGGTPCFNNNIQWMNDNGITIYISTTLSTLFNRLKNEQQNRPLITSLNLLQLKNYIKNKLAQREPFYKQATFIVDAKKLSKTSLKKLYLQ